MDTGIDIRDSLGRTLGLADYRGVTMPIAHLVTVLTDVPHGPAFLELWERQTGQRVDDALFSSGSSAAEVNGGCLPTVFFAGRSLALDTTTSANQSHRTVKKQVLKDALPFQPGDAQWLFNRFLEERYPNGGRLDLGNPALYTNINTVWGDLAG